MPGNEDWVLVKRGYLSANGRWSYEELIVRDLDYDFDVQSNDDDDGFASIELQAIIPVSGNSPPQSLLHPVQADNNQPGLR